MPRPAPKSLGLAPAWMALPGATKRMPSAEATSPFPHTWGIGRAFCAGGVRGLAAAIVSGRMKFWLTQDSRLRLSAGWSVRTIGSKPMLQAWAIRPPHRLGGNSSTRAGGSLKWVKGQAGGELLDARMARGDMGKGVGETGACGSFQHDVREVDLRYPCRDGRLQGDEAGRPLDPVEWAQHQLVPAVAALDPGSRIVGQVDSHLAPGAVQPRGEVAYVCLGIWRTVERAADGQAGGVPSLAAQQALPGVGVAHAGRDEHVAPLQPGPERFEGCEDVGAVVSDATGAIQGMALPGRTEKRGRRVLHAGAGPVVHAAQVIQRGDNRLAGWRSVERDPLQQGREQRAHAPPLRGA